jgi:tetratricopeptide (TPR) repeat protein
MSARRKTSLVAAAVLIVSLAAAVVMLRPLERAQRAGHSDTEDALYIPSARAIRAMSLGYTGLAADIYWTRVVQYFGRRHVEGSNGFPLLEPLLRLTTDLDPHMIVAYQFGSIFLVPPPPAGAGEPDKAVALVERGIQANPDNWRLYLSLGFIHYQYRRDLPAAIAAFERGSRVPGAHPALRVLAATVALEGGDEKKAAILWRAIYDTTNDKSIRKNALDHLIALQVDAEVTRLEKIVQDFQERNGRTPSNFAEMVASGWLPKAPVDPIGEPYKLLPDGRVEVGVPSYLPFITKGLPEGAKPRVGIQIPGMDR